MPCWTPKRWSTFLPWPYRCRTYPNTCRDKTRFVRAMQTSVALDHKSFEQGGSFEMGRPFLRFPLMCYEVG